MKKKTIDNVYFCWNKYRFDQEISNFINIKYLQLAWIYIWQGWMICSCYCTLCIIVYNFLENLILSSVN